MENFNGHRIKIAQPWVTQLKIDYVEDAIKNGWGDNMYFYIEKLEKLGFPLFSNSYDYLLAMPLWNLTFEKVEELKKQRNLKQIEFDNLKAKSVEDIWLSELDNLLEKYLIWIENKKKEDESFTTKKKSKKKKSRKGKLKVI